MFYGSFLSIYLPAPVFHAHIQSFFTGDHLPTPSQLLIPLVWKATKTARDCVVKLVVFETNLDTYFHSF